jgi:hypothetical protein
MNAWLIFQIIEIVAVALLAFIFLFKMSIYFIPLAIMLAASIYFCACVESLQQLLELENDDLAKPATNETA